MPALSEEAIAHFLAPYLAPATAVMPAGPSELYARLSTYLDLLLRWNARTNLTAIRDPHEIVRRHFGESLLLGGMLPPSSQTLLDLGSGAGFPGIPIQLLHPGLAVTLAESQGKKASFLREAVRSLGLKTAVHGGRAEDLPSGTRFDVVALRAVDDMSAAISVASRLTNRLLLLTTRGDTTLCMLDQVAEQPIPDSTDRVARLCVPRGTHKSA